MRRLAHRRPSRPHLRDAGRLIAKPYPLQPAFQIFVLGWSPLGWTNAKKALSFAQIFNDGDDEGSFVLDRPPTSDEAAVIRHYVGITKKREVRPDLVLRLRKNLPQEGRECA
jgi:hypothetical protein